MPAAFPSGFQDGFMTDRRLIEDSLPLAEIGEASTKEKSGPLGHHGRLHIWWARRPLAACRAAIYASLLAAPLSEEERKQQHSAIKNFVSWNTVSPANDEHKHVLKAAQLIGGNADSAPPIILDPFTGGGAIPLEAQRLGCKAIAHDLNPVAHIIQLATCYYPQRFSDLRSQDATSTDLFGKKERPLLSLAVERWSSIVANETQEILDNLFPQKAGSRDIAYIWARTISCSNPACRVSIPLVNQWSLSKASGVYLFPSVKRDKSAIYLQIRSEVPPKDFKLSEGTIKRANVSCPVCGQVTPSSFVRSESRAGKLGEQLIAVVSTKESIQGRFYREPNTEDYKAIQLAEEMHLILKKTEVAPGLSAIPDEKLPPVGSLGFRVNNYGFLEWGMLFNARQCVALHHFSEIVAGVQSRIRDEFFERVGEDADEFAKAVVTFLGLMVDRAAENMSTLCRWNSKSEKVQGTFGRQALPMVWDYVESNPFGGSVGDFRGYVKNVIAFIENCAQGPAAKVTRGSADRLFMGDETVDAVITDPPYYDAVPYADLSDFFYVWLRRTLRNIHSQVLQTSLTPKRAEMIQNPGANKSQKFFEDSMRGAFQEAHRVLVPNGICVVIFAHKTTTAWETMLNGLLSAGFVVTASWPIATENQSRLRAQGSASLSSSVFIVCRKRSAHDDGFLDDIQPALLSRLHERLNYFWTQGIRGADFFMSAIGPAVEVFGRYQRVLRLSGEEVSIAELLEMVRGIVADYALQQIVKGERASNVDQTSRFYVLWRWSFGTAPVDSGEAIHLAQSLGCEFDALVAEKGVLEKKKNKVHLKGPADRMNIKALGELTGTGVPLIDVLHRAANLWREGERQQLADFLTERLPPNGLDRMQRLAQSIIDVLAPDDKERTLYENYLVGARSLPAPTEKGDPHTQENLQF